MFYEYLLVDIIYVTVSVWLVVSMSASHTVAREFASRPGHTKPNLSHKPYSPAQRLEN